MKRPTFIIVLLILNLCAFIGSSQVATEARNFWEEMIIKNAETIDNRWKAFAGNIEVSLVQPNCYQAMERALQSSLDEEWAAKLIYSNGFATSDFAASLLREQYTFLGDFEQCISVDDVPINTSSGNNVTFDGQYCLATFETPRQGSNSNSSESANLEKDSSFYRQLVQNKLLPSRGRLPLVVAICAPSTCTADEMSVLIGEYLKPHFKAMQVSVDYCQRKHQLRVADDSSTLMMAIFILALFFVSSLLGTFLYSFVKFVQSHWVLSLSSAVLAFCECFHIGHNFKRLFKVSSQKQHALDLSFIYGIKVYFMSTVIQFHSFFFIPVLLHSKVSPFVGYPSFYEPMRTGFFNNTERGFFVMDIFFALSGFLVAYMVVSKNKTMPNFGCFVLGRWLRLVPGVIAVLCLTIVIQHIGSGPLFHKKITRPFIEPCSKFWWTHVFFINNLGTFDTMCGPNLWFAATEFQLHLLAYPILLIYFRKPVLAYVSSFALIVLSFLAFSFIILATSARIPYFDVVNFQFDLPLEHFRLFYTSPLLHLIPYLLGILFALALLRLKTRPSYPSHFDYLSLLFFFLIIICHNFPLMSKNPNEQSHYEGIGESFYFVAIFLIHALLLVAIFFSLLFASPKFWLKQLLSSHFFVPLSRLSYGIYLVNIPLILLNVLQNSQTQKLSNLYVVQTFFTVYFESILLALLINVFIEAPVANVFKLVIFKKEAISQEPSKVKMDCNEDYEKSVIAKDNLEMHIQSSNSVQSTNH